MQSRPSLFGRNIFIVFLKLMVISAVLAYNQFDKSRNELIYVAIITCPECARKISDRAEHCPHCGLPRHFYNLSNSHTNIAHDEISGDYMGIKAAPIDLSKWCGYIVKVGHITAALIVLAHVVWYFAARSILAWPPDVYLRNYIILPAIGFLVINTVVDICVRSARFPLPAKEYLSLSLFIIFSLYLTMTHDLSKVLLCSYIFPIFASTIFSNVILTRRMCSA